MNMSKDSIYFMATKLGLSDRYTFTGKHYIPASL